MKPMWMRLLRPLATLLACSLMAAGVAKAEEDPPGRVGRLADSRGQVWMLDVEQGEWVDAQRNRPLTSGDRLATDRDGRLELQIGSTIVRLDERSDLELRRVDDDRIEMVLHAGAAAVRVREPEMANEVQLETAEGRFLPRGVSLFRVDKTERGSLAAVTAGEVQFDSADSTLVLRPGQRAELWLDGGDRRTHYSWSALPNDEFERWVRQEDDRDMRRAERRPVSPEMTGADDLDRHGRWDTHPEYGSVWYPTVVQTGWAPYRYGHWAFISPWGWTWVDDAPWGFAPFHYGRWVHWHGRWAWAPGTYVRRPVYAPAMVAWVGGAHFGVNLRIGGRPGPAVGWVPLAPREVYVPSYRYSPRYWGHVNQPYGGRPEPNRPGPRQPVMYTNQGVPGGVTAVSSDVLQQRKPVGQAARVDDEVLRRTLRDQRALTQEAPPAPDRPQRRRDDSTVGAPRAPGDVRVPSPAQRGNGVGPVQVLREPGRSGDAPPPPVRRPPAQPAAATQDMPRSPAADMPRGVSPEPIRSVPRGAVGEMPRAPGRAVEPAPVPRAGQPMPVAPAQAPNPPATRAVPPPPVSAQPGAPQGHGQQAQPPARPHHEPVGPAAREPQAPGNRGVGAPAVVPQGQPAPRDLRQEQDPRREREQENKRRDKEARREAREALQRQS
jgi:FecR protein